MSTESKRQWRVKNPTRYAEYERKRAQARRSGHWGRLGIDAERPPCHSSDSYDRYDRSAKRMLSRLRYDGAGKEARLLDLDAIIRSGMLRIRAAAARTAS